MKKFILVSALFCFLAVPAFSHAAQEGVLSTKYTERVPARFGTGVMNTLFGWTAFFMAPHQAFQEGANAGEALGRALAHPAAYTFLGIWDLGTFWVPGETGRSMAVPRHVWMPRPAPAASAPAVETPAENHANA